MGDIHEDELDENEEGGGDLCGNCANQGRVDNYGLCFHCRHQMDHQQDKDD